MTKINKKITVIINLLNQETFKKSITTEFKIDIIKAVEKHFCANWKNIEYKEVNIID